MSFQDHLTEAKKSQGVEEESLNQPGTDKPVADAENANWVDLYAPDAAKPFLRLMRADRPIGVWLLLWPCWWSAALAALSTNQSTPNLWHLILFAIGATAMRGAGCAYNDIVDRDIDAKVARTKSRPIPSGAISVRNAKIFMIALCLVGLLVLLQFNGFSILLGICSLAPVAIYPFMKRFMSWPQLVLGLAFSWGAFMGWAATHGSLDLPAFLLYLAAVSWTIGYDTIYAHQDKEDDALLGLGSTALAFAEKTKLWLCFFYGATILLILLATLSANGGIVSILGLAIAAMQLTWQIRTLDLNDAQICLSRFRANREFGAIIFLSLVADAAFQAIWRSIA